MLKPFCCLGGEVANLFTFCITNYGEIIQSKAWSRVMRIPICGRGHGVCLFFWFDRVCFFFGQGTRKHQTNPHLDLLHSWFSSIHILYIIIYIYPVCPDDFLRFFGIDGGLSRGHRISLRCVHECLDGAWAICGAISTAKIRCFPIFARGSTWQKRGC